MNEETLNRIKSLPLLRPLSTDLELVKVTVKKDPKQGRRGRYIFELPIRWYEEEELQSDKIGIYVTPSSKPYFITQQIILEEGEDPEAKIDQVKNIEGCILKEKLFKEQLFPIKELAILALQNRNQWRRNNNSPSFEYRHQGEDKEIARILIK